MNSKILALNLGLLALLGTIGWMLRVHWLEARAQHLSTLAKPPHGTTQLPPPSPTPPAAVVPANYIDVAQKTLFSKDRNPNVIIEVVPPPQPKPEEPPPARPQYFGQIAIDEPVAFLSNEQGGQKGFRVGDKVGQFKLIAFNHDTITFEWKGKNLQYPIAELKPKEPVVTPGAPVAARPAAPASTLMGTNNSAQENKNPAFGPQNGETRICVPGDNSPSGTVKDGFRKSVIPGAFGPMCQWEPVR